MNLNDDDADRLHRNAEIRKAGLVARWMTKWSVVAVGTGMCDGDGDGDGDGAVGVCFVRCPGPGRSRHP